MNAGVKPVIILGLLCILSSANGQSGKFSNPAIDSLKSVLISTSDSNRVDVLNRIAYDYYYYKIDSTKVFALMAIDQATQLGYKKGLAEAQRLMGISEKAHNNHQKAIEWFDQGLKTAREIQYNQGIADILNSLGIFYDYIGDHDQAIQYYKEGIEYQILTGKRLREGIFYTNMGVSYLHKNDLDSAGYFYRKSLHILDSANYESWEAMAFSQYGGYLVKRGNYDSAIYYTQKAMKLSISLGQTFHLRKSYQNMAEIGLANNEIVEAKDFAIEALSLSRQIGFLPYVIEALQINYQIAKRQNLTGRALSFLEQTSELKDSLRYDQARGQAGLFAYSHALQLKENENLMLRQEKETERAINMSNNSLIQRQRFVVLAVTVILLCMSLIAFVFFYRRRKEHDINKKLIDANQLLELQKNNITSTLHMVEQLNSQLKAQNNALNQSAIVYITDLNANIVNVNDNFCNVTGYSHDELEGKNIRIVNSGEHSREQFAEMWGKIAKGQTWRGELKNKKKDGDFYWCDAAIAPIFDELGKPKMFFALQFEITQRKRMLEELATKSHELEDLNKLKDKLLSIVSHDFRSPLNSLQGTLSLLLRGALSQDEFKMLTKDLLEKLDHTYYLLENLLHWARSQMEGLKVYPRKIDLHKITQDCVDLLAPIADKKLVKLQNHLAPQAMAYADDEMIKLVIRNLISNAIKFSNASGIIELNAELDPEGVVVHVKDSGTGISNANQAKLFKAESVTTSGTSNERGIGLGLLLCKDFVERNGGSIWFESEYMKGSTFHFKLPVREVQP